jgi:hypothetical protein
MRAAIPLLEARVTELRALDVQSISKGSDPSVQGLAARIMSTLSRIYGEDTLEFERLKEAGDIDDTYYGGPIFILGTGSGPVGPSVQEIRAGVDRGRNRAVALLAGEANSLREALEHQQQHSAPARLPGQVGAEWAVDDDAPGRYTTAAVCQRGHALTGDAVRHPVAKFCADCGAPVITTCPGCGTGIRGHFVPPGVTGVGGRYTPPNFCFSCGQPVPWTTEKLAAARDLADELEGISADDRAKLKTAIDDVASGGARAEAGAVRVKRMLGKASTAVGQALWKIVVDVASEAAKKILTGA